MRLPRRAAAVLALGALLAACEREQRRFHEPWLAAAQRAPPVREPGPGAPPAPPAPYQENAWAISQGQRLFSWFNCTGCHAEGGGDSGPALMDGEWLYGSAPQQVFASIAGGRPNGMPSFGGLVPEAQVWQLVAYVRSLAALVPKDARPGRADRQAVKEPETLREPERPAAPPRGAP
jgi:cytochrome c oxidase cbb3-type subunit 3